MDKVALLVKFSCIGVLNHWSIGALEHWTSLEHWSIESLEHRSIGTLEHQKIAMHWTPLELGVLEKHFPNSNKSKTFHMIYDISGSEAE